MRGAGKVITQILNGEAPTIFGDGQQSRNFTYVDNAVEANLLACQAPASDAAGRVFNVPRKALRSQQNFRMLKELTDRWGDLPALPGDAAEGQ